MKKYFFSAVALACQIFFTLPVSAEIYKWTDNNGKVHYGDKKMADNAEDITAIVTKQNIDTSTTEHQKLEAIFRKENAADREFQAQQSMPDPNAEAQSRRCEQAKQRLFTLERRVEFVDETGKVIKTTEKERASRANDMRKIVAEQCPS